MPVQEFKDGREEIDSPGIRKSLKEINLEKVDSKTTGKSGQPIEHSKSMNPIHLSPNAIYEGTELE